MSSLTITDATGHSQTLLVGSGTPGQAAWYELPPSGPEGVFDVRFESQRMMEVIDPAARVSREFPITLRSAVPPVTLAWTVRGDAARLELRDGINGAVLPPRTLESSGSLVLSHPALGRLLLTVSPGGIPATFALGQNYPNPFNPSTRLTYALPEPAVVTLAVFDVLGKRVATLQNERQDAGYHSATWDGRNDAGSVVSSGLYFCRIDASAHSGTSFRQTIKMLLMK
jgi:hypothetical protein